MMVTGGRLRSLQVLLERGRNIHRCKYGSVDGEGQPQWPGQSRRFHASVNRRRGRCCRTAAEPLLAFLFGLYGFTMRVVLLTARQHRRLGSRNSPALWREISQAEISIERGVEAKLAAKRQSLADLRLDSATMAREKLAGSSAKAAKPMPRDE